MHILIYFTKNYLRYRTIYIFTAVFFVIVGSILYFSFSISNLCLNKIQSIRDDMSQRYTIVDNSTYHPSGVREDEEISDALITVKKMIELCETEGIERYVLSKHIEFLMENILLENSEDYKASYSSKIFLEGYSSCDIDEFNFGINEIVEGRMYSKDNEVVISKYISEKYNIKLGGSLNQYTDLPLTVVGIYEVVNNIYDDNYKVSIRTIPTFIENVKIEQIVYTTLNTVSSTYNTSTYYNLYPVIYISNPEKIEDIQNLLYEKGLNPKYKIGFDRGTFDTYIKIISNNYISFGLIYVITLCISAILYLIIMIILLSFRKTEIATLSIMGLSKIKIIIGFFYENFIFISCCNIIAFLISIFIVSPLVINYGFDVFKLFNIKINFTIEFLFQFITISAGFVLLSCIIFSIYLFKNSALKLLTE